MNIDEIKAKLGYGTLNLNYSEKDGVKTEWLRHWDNEKRIAISIHKETLEKIKADKTLSTLGLNAPEEIVSATSGTAYTALRIVAYTASDATL